MEVYIAFAKLDLPVSTSINEWTGQVFGSYTFASLFVVLGSGRMVMFSATLDVGFFEEFPASVSTPAKWAWLNKTYDFLRLGVTPEEGDLILRTCRGCVRARKRYNLRDLLLKNVPFREPEELALFDTHSLNDTQSVILILRECLPLDNPVAVQVRGLHSRLASASALFEVLSPLLHRAPPVCHGVGVTVVDQMDAK
jgi:hypothetical protein